MAMKGPIAGSQYGKKPGRAPIERPGTKKRAPSKQLAADRNAALTMLPANIDPPPAPSDLSEMAAEAWVSIWTGFGRGVWREGLDFATVHQFCQLLDERALARQSIDDFGLLLDEPIVTPRGEVLEVTRKVINPAEAALRRADDKLIKIAASLGLSPASRARLGLALTAAQAAGTDAASLIAKFSK